MYCFKDKDDPPQRVTLRPEMTPTLARMILSLSATAPSKFSVNSGNSARNSASRHSPYWPQLARRCSAAASASTTSGTWTSSASRGRGLRARRRLRFFFPLLGAHARCDRHVLQEGRHHLRRRRHQDQLAKVLSTILTDVWRHRRSSREVCVIVDKLDKIGPDATVELLMATPNGMPGGRRARRSSSLSRSSRSRNCAR